MIEALIFKIAISENVDPSLLQALCYQETRFHNVVTKNDGDSDSYGVCQIKSVAAQQVGLPQINLNIAENNIRVAALYLKYNIERCGGEVAGLAAYNTGRCIQNPKRGGYVDHVLEYKKFFNYKLNVAYLNQ